MSKRRLWTLENNLSFALFSSFASRKRRRCVRFEKRNLSLVSPLAKSLKMRTNKLATLFRSSTRSFSSFKERERNYYDGKTVLVSLLLSFSLSPSLRNLGRQRVPAVSTTALDSLDNFEAATLMHQPAYTATHFAILQVLFQYTVRCEYMQRATNS